MAYERKIKSDEELKAFRQMNSRKGIAVRMEKARLRNIPACHPDRVMFKRTGLCQQCFLQESVPQEISLTDAVKLAEKMGNKEEVAALKNAALALLHERLPAYAEAHFTATKVAALKGDAKPAEWALQNIKAPGGAAVIEPVLKTPAENGVKILIGVNLGGIPVKTTTSNVMEAEVVRALERAETSDQAE